MCDLKKSYFETTKMSYTDNNSKSFNGGEIVPTGQSSSTSKSGNEVTERKFYNLHRSKNSSTDETDVIVCTSTLEHSSSQNLDGEVNSDYIRKKIPIGEKLSQEIEEIKVEIMPPCYGGTHHLNTLDDLENGNNHCYLSDDEGSETTTLLPKNKRRRPQQHTNDKSLSEKSSPILSQPRMGDEPKDSYSFVYLVFFLLGLSTLLPWNFFISINQFWDYRFRDVNSSNLIYFVVEGNSSNSEGNQTELQKEFTSYLSIASNVPNAIFVILNAIYGAQISIRKRLLVSGAVIIFLFLGMTILAKTNSDAWQTEFLYVVLTLVVLINIFAATFQSGVFGVAGKFPPKYMGSCMVGQAFGGVFPALVDILVVAINIEPENEGFACLLIATLSLFISFMAFIGTKYSDFFRYHAGEEGGPELLINEESAVNNIVEDNELNAEHNSAFERFKHVIKHSWEYCLAVFLTFCITLSLWPAVAVLVESQYKNSKTHSTWAYDYFTPVTVFLLFNVGDLIGRSIANVLKFPNRTKKGKLIVLMLSLLRVIFIPLYIFCNASPENRSLPVIFSSDADFILITTVFALSNGYLGNLCMLHGPKTVEDSVLQEETAMVLVACLVLGTGCGSFLSYPIIQIL